MALHLLVFCDSYATKGLLNCLLNFRKTEERDFLDQRGQDQCSSTVQGADENI
jgi:hypothetical protein